MINKLSSIILVSLILISLVPVTLAKYFNAIIIILLILYVIIFAFLLLLDRIKLKKELFFPILCSICFAIYIAFPFRIYDRFSPSTIWLLLYPSILLLPKVILIKTNKHLINTIVVLSFLSIIVFFLYFLDLITPFYEINMGERLYDSYLVSVVLKNQYFKIGSMNFYRASSVFAEPGHFGLIVSYILYSNFNILRTKKGLVLLSAGIITFSFSFYIMTLFLFIYKSFATRHLRLLFSVFFIGGLLILFLPQEILDSFFTSKAEGALDNRTSVYFRQFYNDFIRSDNVLWGLGRDVSDVMNLYSSDYRSFIMKFGLIGTLLFFSMIFSFRIPLSRFIPYIMYCVITFLHRSWFVDYLFFMMFFITMYYGINLSVKDEKVFNKIR